MIFDSDQIVYPLGCNMDELCRYCTLLGISCSPNRFATTTTLSNPDPSLSLAAFVRQRRKRLGLTQVAFADRAGVGLRFLRELERGKASLRMDKVNEVLAFFGHELGPVPRPNPYREPTDHP